MNPVYMVYWCEPGDAAPVPHAQGFPADAMSDALRFAEALRARQHRGEAVSFVTLCSEHPNAVGRAGVADPPADYAWKRRA
ncbi:hypothetical protein C7408_101203 [Paraburkholderia caballeronis]|nr:hypothetical protein C7406_108203 [Paraburkholderia caballeronis]TDV20691.1 hypothetical protein C7408_101203 [Paraburkholderia caballeronis]TDV33159.1 hypothetical protein C7404_101299 [Paraburkholderia caballeronis]